MKPAKSLYFAVTALFFVSALPQLSAQQAASAKSGQITIAQPRPATQHFFCNTGYSLEACHQQIAALRTVVAKFPTEALGEWTWVLVRSQDWKQFWRTLGVKPKSPAITCMEKRVTFIEEVLVAEVPGRAKELIASWHMSMTELLNTAMENEMAHTLHDSPKQETYFPEIGGDAIPTVRDNRKSSY
jgi:hypothetical protein